MIVAICGGILSLAGTRRGRVLPTAALFPLHIHVANHLYANYVFPGNYQWQARARANKGACVRNNNNCGGGSEDDSCNRSSDDAAANRLEVSLARTAERGTECVQLLDTGKRSAAAW